MSTNEEKLQAFLDLKTQKSKVEVQRACGMAAQMKKFCPGIMLTFPLLQKLLSHSTVFTWNDTLQADFDSLQKALKEPFKLSPLDTNKRIFCYTDTLLGLPFFLGLISILAIHVGFTPRGTLSITPLCLSARRSFLT